jgi:uncharacterized protein YdhG (YjbR/CyaY superfamily)
MMDTVDEYIAEFPDDVRPLLEGIRAAIHRVLPEAAEEIRYGMPAVMLGGWHAIYFAGWKGHLDVYPVHPSNSAIESELARYRSGKDALRFPLDRPIPYDLIERVIRMLVREQHG